MNLPNWNNKSLPQPTRDMALMHDQLDEFGFCLIENAIESVTLERLQKRLIEQAKMERQLHQHKNPANMDPVNQWVGMLLNKGEVFMELMHNELCMQLLEHMIGDNFLVSCVDAQIQHPGAGDMPLHTDQWWMPSPIDPDRVRTQPGLQYRGMNGSSDATKPDQAIYNIAEANVMWMISDFSVENGATRVVPGSHVSGRQPDSSVPHPVQTVAAEGPAGTAIAFDGRIWHAGAANTSKQSRYGITTSGCGPQFRTIENYTRGMRPEVFERCDTKTLQRLGFQSWSGYGHTGNPEEEVASAGDCSLGELKYDSNFDGK